MRAPLKTIASILVISVVTSGVSPVVAWTCVDGTPCAPDCRMIHGAVPTSAANTTPTKPHCSNCPESPKATAKSYTHDASSGSKCGCTTPRCVLRISSQPDANKAPVAAFIVDSPATLALSQLVIANFAGCTESCPSAPRAPPLKGEQTQPLSPRAPPVLL